MKRAYRRLVLGRPGTAKKKAAKQMMTFKSVIGMAGIDFGPCEHELEL